MIKLRITLGDSATLTLPENAVADLKLRAGDTLFLTETKQGYLLAPYNPEFERQMQHAENITSRYGNTLKKLAQ
jgi:putative addiction module antidote